MADKRRNNSKQYWTNKFTNMESIYDKEGNIRNDLGMDRDQLNKLYGEAVNKGYGSFYDKNSGKEYTIYAHRYDENGNKIGINTTGKGITDSNINKDRDPLESYQVLKATHNYNHRNNIQEYSNLNSFNPPVVSEVSKSEKIVTPGSDFKLGEGNISSLPKPKNFDFGLSQDQITNMNSIPETGRKSNFRQTLGLYEDSDKYFNNKDVIRSMNHYYGEGGWNGYNYSHPNGSFIDPRNSMRSTLDYIYNNTNLTKDRMGKTQDYLAMESQRLDRGIGNYGGISYRDLLDYFSNKDNLQWQGGKYNGNYDKFMQELYELGASKNGMQNHEFKRLFGDSYDDVMRNIQTHYGVSLKQGGIIKMLFI